MAKSCSVSPVLLTTESINNTIFHHFLSASTKNDKLTNISDNDKVSKSSLAELLWRKWACKRPQGHILASPLQHHGASGPRNIHRHGIVLHKHDTYIYTHTYDYIVQKHDNYIRIHTYRHLSDHSLRLAACSIIKV